MADEQNLKFVMEAVDKVSPTVDNVGNAAKSAAKDVQSLEDSLSEVEKVNLSKAKAQMQEYTQMVRKLRIDAKKLNLSGFDQAADRLGVALKVEAETDQAELAIENLGAAIKELRDQRAQISVQADSDQAKKDLAEVDRWIDILEAQRAKLHFDADVTEAKQKLDEVNKDAEKLDAEKPEVAVDADVTEAKQKLDEVNKDAEKLDDKKHKFTVGADVQRAKDAVASFKQEIRRTVVNMVVGVVVKQGIQAGLEYNAMLETAQMSWATLLQSEEKAAVQMQKLKQMADFTPFEFGELDGAAKKLSMAGFEGDNLFNALTKVGDAVSAIGGGSDELNGVATAIFQIATKGKLSAEEMNQLAERGIPSWDILAKSMGKSTAEIMKMGEEGKLMADDVIPRLVEGMGERFGGSMEKQSQTMSGLVSTAKDLLNAFFGDVTGNVFEELKGDIQEAIQYLSSADGKKLAQDIGKGLADAFRFVKAAAKAVWDLRVPLLAVYGTVKAIKGVQFAKGIVKDAGEATKGIKKVVASIPGIGKAAKTAGTAVTGAVKTAAASMAGVGTAATASTGAIVAGIAGISVAAVAGGLALYSLGASIYETFEKRGRAGRAVENYKKSLEEVNQTYNESMQVVRQQAAESGNSYDQAYIKLQRIKQMLAKGQNGDEMDGLVNSLIETLPEAEGAVEKVNGKWRVNVSEIEKAIQKAKQYAEVLRIQEEIKAGQTKIDKLYENNSEMLETRKGKTLRKGELEEQIQYYRENPSEGAKPGALYGGTQRGTKLQDAERELGEINSYLEGTQEAADSINKQVGEIQKENDGKQTKIDQIESGKLLPEMDLNSANGTKAGWYQALFEGSDGFKTTADALRKAKLNIDTGNWNENRSQDPRFGTHDNKESASAQFNEVALSDMTTMISEALSGAQAMQDKYKNEDIGQTEADIASLESFIDELQKVQNTLGPENMEAVDKLLAGNSEFASVFGITKDELISGVQEKAETLAATNTEFADFMNSNNDRMNEVFALGSDGMMAAFQLWQESGGQLPESLAETFSGIQEQLSTTFSGSAEELQGLLQQSLETGGTELVAQQFTGMIESGNAAAMELLRGMTDGSNQAGAKLLQDISSGGGEASQKLDEAIKSASGSGGDDIAGKIAAALSTPVKVDVNVNANVTTTTTTQSTPQNAAGTGYWLGGLTQINEKGDEIIELPSGSKVYPHDKSNRMLREIDNNKGNITININGTTIREDADIDKMVDQIVRKLERTISKAS